MVYARGPLDGSATWTRACSVASLACRRKQCSRDAGLPNVPSGSRWGASPRRRQGRSVRSRRSPGRQGVFTAGPRHPRNEPLSRASRAMIPRFRCRVRVRTPARRSVRGDPFARLQQWVLRNARDPASLFTGGGHGADARGDDFNGGLCGAGTDVTIDVVVVYSRERPNLAPSASTPTILPQPFLPTNWVTTWGWRTIGTNRTILRDWGGGMLTAGPAYGYVNPRAFEMAAWKPALAGRHCRRRR